jgi:prepilin peptidase CpaA
MITTGVLGAAVYTDLRSHRIPNKLIIVGLILAPVVQLAAHGMHGVLLGLLAAGIGLGCFLPFYALRAMGAGDVKLMAVVGFLTSPSGVLYAVVLSLLAGGACALAYLIWRAGSAYVASAVQHGGAAAAAPAFVAARLARRDRLPFAVPVAIGGVSACLIQGMTVRELTAWL